MAHDPARRQRGGISRRGPAAGTTTVIAVVLVPLLALAAIVSPALAGAVPTVLLLGAALDYLRDVERARARRAAESSTRPRPAP